MKIFDDLLSTLDYDAPVVDIRQGPFQTAVQTRRCGLASTPHDTGPHHGHVPVKKAGSMLESVPRELARMALSESSMEAAIGMAAVNSLLEIDEGRCLELDAGKLLMEKGGGLKVAIVGHFPFIPRLREAAGSLWVIEKNPVEGDLAESEGTKYIPQADVVGITGTAFTNHTIEGLLALCRRDAYVIMLGDTAPLSPVLFDYGIDAISGTIVTDPAIALRCVSQGATYRQLKGVRKITMKK